MVGVAWCAYQYPGFFDHQFLRKEPIDTFLFIQTQKRNIYSKVTESIMLPFYQNHKRAFYKQVENVCHNIRE